MLRIREIRESKRPRLTQEKLANAAGLTTSTIRRIEQSGEGTTRSLRKIADALGCSIGELYEAEQAS